jgi:CarboxypepD_reg-like domain
LINSYVKYLIGLHQLNALTLIIIAFSINGAAQSKIISVKGHVKDANDNASLKGVNVSVLNTPFGTSTDSFGDYMLNLKPGKYEITFSYVGYKTLQKRLVIAEHEKNIQLNVSLISSPYTIGGVTVKANRDIGTHIIDSLKAKDLQNMPNLFSDVIRSVKILPGVTSNDELSSTYNVRGGNFDQNLIYLNGYEIYQPYLIQQGVQQSQSIINENMVGGLQFYNGAFPVEFGDKMSSVLAVDYDAPHESTFGGEFNADLFNLGLTVHDKTGNLHWMSGVRYAYPSLFDKTLQTKGGYKPSFDDFQFFGSYDLQNNSKIQLLFMTAKNDFDFTPQSWFGNFQTGYLDIKQITLDFNGYSDYKYYSTLLGLKYITPLSDNSGLTTSLSFYSDRESYNKNLSYDVYYNQEVYDANTKSTYLETGYEFANDYLNTLRYEIKSDYNLNYEKQNIKAGADIRFAKMNSSTDESTYFKGDDSVLNSSSYSNSMLNTNFNSISVYAEDNILLSSWFSASAGLRALQYYFNNEFLVSPRASVSFKPDTSNNIDIAWGYYYQPPYFYETRDKDLTIAKSLVAQRNIQYDLSWRKRFHDHSKFTAEVYYRDLNRLIPYNIDQLDLVYGDKNNYEGYAYGLDLQYQGELVPGMETWIGYDYLNAEERQTPGNYSYVLSPLDQTNTIRIFLQDRAKNHPNFQAHVMLLLGSGYTFHPMISVPGESPGSYQLVPDYNITEIYPFYFRVDMGLTFDFKLSELKNIIITADVFNVFNQYNITSFSWYHVFSTTTEPVPVPNILSPRYFNIGFKLNF